MSLTPSINFVCRRALRLIGEYALRASGPRPEAMEEAAYYLDMQMGFVSAMELTWWLVPETATFPLVAGQRDYTLMEVVGQNQAPDGIQFVSALFVDDATSGHEVGQVNLLRRHEFEQVLGQNPNAEGPPSIGYIDRQRNPTLRFVEAPDAAGSYRARMVFQAYSPDLTQTRDLKKLAQFRDGWTLYLVYALAAHLASGAVRRLPADEVRMLEGKAKEYLHHLQAHDGHEAQTEHRVRFHNLG